MDIENTYDDTDSELTELSEDEDQLDPSPSPRPATTAPSKRKASTKQSRQKTVEEYDPTGKLPPPRQISLPVSCLYTRIEDGDLDLDPPYQRGIAWGELKQVALIDSLIRNFYVPPLVFAVRDIDGVENWTCIDGKQRLTAMRRFIKGEIFVPNPETNKRFYFIRGETSKKLVLSEEQKKRFMNTQVVCIEYNSLSFAQEKEVFYRVQNGVSLSASERLRAISSPWTEFILSIQQEVIPTREFLDDLLPKPHSTTPGGRDFHCLVLTSYMCSHYPTFKYEPLSDLERWLNNGKSVPEKFRISIPEAFRILVALIQRNDSGCFDGISLLELVMTGILVFAYKDRCSLQQLASGIQAMRSSGRSKYKVYKMEGKTAKYLFSCLKGLKLGGRASEPAAASAIKLIKADEVGTIKENKQVKITEKEEASPVEEHAGHKRKRDDDDVGEISSKAPPKTRAASAASKQLSKKQSVPKKVVTAKKAVVTKPATPIPEPPRIAPKKSASSLPKFTKKSATTTAASSPPVSSAATRIKRKVGYPQTPSALAPEPAPSNVLTTFAPSVVPSIPTPATTPSNLNIPKELPPSQPSTMQIDSLLVSPVGASRSPVPSSARPEGSPARPVSNRLAAIYQAKEQSKITRSRISVIDGPGPTPSISPPSETNPGPRFNPSHSPAPLDQAGSSSTRAISRSFVKHSQSPPADPRLVNPPTTDPRRRPSVGLSPLMTDFTPAYVQTQAEPSALRRGPQGSASSPSTPSHLPLQLQGLPSGPAASSSSKPQPLSPTLPNKPLPLSSRHPSLESAATTLATPAGSIPRGPRASLSSLSATTSANRPTAGEQEGRQGPERTGPHRPW